MPVSELEKGARRWIEIGLRRIEEKKGGKRLGGPCRTSDGDQTMMTQDEDGRSSESGPSRSRLRMPWEYIK